MNRLKSIIAILLFTVVSDAISKEAITINELLEVCDNFTNENNKRLPQVLNNAMTIKNLSCETLEDKVAVNYMVTLDTSKMVLSRDRKIKAITSLCTNPDTLGLLKYFAVVYTFFNVSNNAYIDKILVTKADCNLS